jgi:hypothetical protein
MGVHIIDTNNDEKLVVQSTYEFVKISPDGKTFLLLDPSGHHFILWKWFEDYEVAIQTGEKKLSNHKKPMRSPENSEEELSSGSDEEIRENIQKTLIPLLPPGTEASHITFPIGAWFGDLILVNEPSGKFLLFNTDGKLQKQFSKEDIPSEWLSNHGEIATYLIREPEASYYVMSEYLNVRRCKNWIVF